MRRTKTPGVIWRCSIGEEDAEGAIEAFDRAIALNDRIADAHWNRALAHLTLGHFAEGWDGYDWRWEARSHG